MSSNMAELTQYIQQKPFLKKVIQIRQLKY